MSAPHAQVPPHVQLMQMAIGGWISRFVIEAAELKIADHLAAGPKSAAELAGPLGVQPRALHRFLRTLAHLGILAHADRDTFTLTPLGEALRTGAPGCARSTILSIVGHWWQAIGDFDYSLRTGKPSVEKVFGKNIFDHFADHPELASMFSEAMVGIHGGEPPAVAEAYDFSTAGLIVDVGGATGHMLAHILRRHPEPKGLLYDRPHVVSDAPALLQSMGVEDRVSIAAGNFFESAPAGGDVYILSHIIHDWTEAQCLTILGNVRAAMKPDSKLLIVEFVLPEDGTPHFGKIADMVMLAIPGGEERTPTEYRELLAKAGLRMTRVVPTASDVSIVEAVPA